MNDEKDSNKDENNETKEMAIKMITGISDAYETKETKRTRP